MGLDKDFLADNYRSMADQELLFIFSNDFKELTPEAQEVLQAEINSRRIGEGLDKVMEIQLKGLSQENLAEYSDIIRNMPCPLCGGTDKKINAVLIFNNHYEDFVIACPDCLRKEIDKASARSVGVNGLLGGFRGIFKAAGQVKEYNRIMKQVEVDIASDDLIYFINKRAGEIELYKDNQQKLSELILHPNATSF